MHLTTTQGPGRGLIAALAVGSIGLLVLGVQPLLYGAYVVEGRIGENRVGLLAAAEIIAIAMGSVAGIAVLRHRSARQVGAAGLMLVAAANLLPAALPLFIGRMLAGFAGGLTVAVAAQTIARRENVNGASGLFLFFQATSQYAILQWFSLMMPGAPAASIQAGLAVLAGVAVIPLLFVPPDPAPTGVEEGRDGRVSAVGLVGLLAGALFVGAAITSWAYLGVWMQTRGIAADRIAPMLTASLVGQMVGALVAVARGTRGRSSVQVLVNATAMLALLLLMLWRGVDGWVGWALVVGFGLAWMIGTPALAGLLIEIDPSRRSLPYAASAQLLGAAVLPTLAGEAFAARGLDLVLVTSIVALIATVLAVFAGERLMRRLAAA